MKKSMQVFGFQCKKRFETSGSVSYDLVEPVLDSDKPLALTKASVTAAVGNVEIHFPNEGHIKAYLRVVLPPLLAKKLDRQLLIEATEDLLSWHGLPHGATYEADLLPVELITRAENRIDTEGKSDGIG